MALEQVFDRVMESELKQDIFDVIQTGEEKKKNRIKKNPKEEANAEEEEEKKKTREIENQKFHMEVHRLLELQHLQDRRMYQLLPFEVQEAPGFSGPRTWGPPGYGLSSIGMQIQRHSSTSIRLRFDDFRRPEWWLSVGLPRKKLGLGYSSSSSFTPLEKGKMYPCSASGIFHSDIQLIIKATACVVRDETRHGVVVRIIRIRVTGDRRAPMTENQWAANQIRTGPKTDYAGNTVFQKPEPPAHHIFEATIPLVFPTSSSSSSSLSLSDL